MCHLGGLANLFFGEGGVGGLLADNVVGGGEGEDAGGAFVIEDGQGRVLGV